MTSPLNPRKYVGPQNYLVPFVDRNRAPTTADIRDPSIGKLYPISQIWRDSSTNNFWILVNIASNLGEWQLFTSGTGDITQLSGDTGVATAVAGNINIVGGTNSGLSFDASGDTVTCNNNNISLFSTVATSNNYTFTWTAPAGATVYDVDIGVLSGEIAGPGTYSMSTMTLRVSSWILGGTVFNTGMVILATQVISNVYSTIITPTALPNNQISINVTNANGATIYVQSNRVLRFFP